jgi:ligand-binding SRPBCC domain-containing protein
MNAKQAKRIKADPELLKRLTKFVALHAFRNTHLEELHHGKAPSSKTGDFSDVKVVTPYGEIPWTELSRFNDDEMKTLMIDVVNHTYFVMFSLFATQSKTLDDLLASLIARDPEPEWNEPKSPFNKS